MTLTGIYLGIQLFSDWIIYSNSCLFILLLIIHLKRFTEAVKVRTLVNYPEALDMSEWLVGPPPAEGCLYQLCAVVRHHGDTAHSGHYTTEACVDGTWFHYDDRRVTPLARFQNVADAYILFYERNRAAT